MKTLYFVGDKVEHKHFGAGEVVALNEKLHGVVIKFERLETVRTILETYDGLKKVG